MSVAVEIEPTKTEHGENFPVASFLIAPRLRGDVLAFYRFARAADDIADHPSISEREKFARLDALEDTLVGKRDSAAAALPLRRVLTKRNLPPTHPLDLLSAFRTDVTKRRYEDWAELMNYCRYSAMPVGRMVLDLHGEAPSTYTFSDPLCSALQVVNHLQDCGKDYAALDRVYLPLDVIDAHGARVEELGGAQSSPALLACIHSLAEKTNSLMPEASKLPLAVKDTRLGLETGAIVALAQRLLVMLKIRDPLSERVHLSKGAALLEGLRGAGRTFSARWTRKGE
ncbi:MAG: squalene synthase HpnC [Methyloceanibacter sp.]|nr:squalene synthase HpnC [Methyloceanibacter sp.]